MSFTISDLIIAFVAGIGSTAVAFLAILFLQQKKLSNDFLTGLPSYRSLLNYMKRHKKGKYVFLLIDIDDFRRFNRESYEKGDQVITGFADALSEKFSSKCEIFRYRLGDEFAMVIPVKTYAGLQEELSAFHTSQTAGFTWACIEYSAKTDSVEEVMRKAGEKLIKKKAE